jgi:hypothetical protein
MNNNVRSSQSNPQTMVGIHIGQKDYSPENNVVKVRSERENDEQGSHSDEEHSRAGNREDARRAIFE